MESPLKGRHFLSVADFSTEEIARLLDTAHRVKEHPADYADRMKRKTLAMIFQKPSLRTRVSFEAGMTQMGGHAIYLAPSDVSMGTRETPEDTALVLSRFADAIMARVFGHDIVEELARHATVPVINGLSDFEHPCQILADLQTIVERKGRLEGLHGCYIGDGNNVAHSLMYGAARMGMHLTVITPEGYAPADEVTEKAQEIGRATGARIATTSDLDAVSGADVLYTDVWASMGQEAEAEARKRIFQRYRIDAEIDYATSRLPNAAIFDQAENRLHAQKALLLHLIGET